MSNTPNRNIEEKLLIMSPKCKLIYSKVDSFIRSTAKDIKRLHRKTYIAYKYDKKPTSVSINVRTRGDVFILYLNIDPDQVDIQPGFTRDVRDKGHNGIGKLEVRLSNLDDLSLARPLIRKSISR